MIMQFTLLFHTVMMYSSTNNDIIYEVVYKDDKKSMNIVEEVSEKNLAYGTNCPVTYFTDDGLELEGKVLLSEPSPDDPSKFVYTILIFMEGDRVRYEMGIKDEHVKYRKVMGNIKSANVVEQDVPPIIADQKESQTETILATASEAPSEKEKETVPSSITCKSAISSDKSSKDGTEGSSKQLHNTPSVTSQNKKNLHVDTTHKDANAGHNQGSNRSTSYSHSSPSESRGASNHESFCLTTPAWLQRNSEVQRDLFCKWQPFVSRLHCSKYHSFILNFCLGSLSCWFQTRQGTEENSIKYCRRNKHKNWSCITQPRAKILQYQQSCCSTDCHQCYRQAPYSF